MLRIYALCQQPKKLHSIFSREAQSKLQNISVTSWILNLLLQEHGHYTPPAALLQMQYLPEMGVGALRKHAGGMFLASDRGGYAAAASIGHYTAPS